jgi:hypothetical protein
METIVVYHQVKADTDCPDGICAAWIASKFFGGEEIMLVGESHRPDYANNYEFPFLTKGNRIVLLDFCYPSSILASIVKDAAELVILDHHHTRMNDISKFQSSILGGYSSEDCGATFAWKYFFPDEPEPWFLIHVLRRDTGKDGYYDGDVPESEAIATAMSRRRDGLVGSQAFPVFEKLLEENPSTLIAEGKALLAERDFLVEQELSRWSSDSRDVLQLKAQNYIVYQVPFLTIQDPRADKYISWIGSCLSRKYGCSIVQFVAIRTSSEPTKISLRSHSSSDTDCGVSDTDCGVIAKYFGGGGHKHAAGFEVKEVSLNSETGWFEIEDRLLCRATH